MFSKEHHAQFVSGNRKTNKELVLDFLEKEGISIHGNPDILIIDSDSFGIDDSKGLKSFQSIRPTGAHGKFVILSFFSISKEAQNALLKLFEEPIGETTFFVLAPTFDILIPTLQSRFELICTGEEKEKVRFDGDEFLRSPINKRVKIISPIFDNKDKESAIALLDAIEKSLYDLKLHNKDIYREIVEDILRARADLRGRSPSVKMLLEHIAYSTPVLK